MKVPGAVATKGQGLLEGRYYHAVPNLVLIANASSVGASRKQLLEQPGAHLLI